VDLGLGPRRKFKRERFLQAAEDPHMTEMMEAGYLPFQALRGPPIQALRGRPIQALRGRPIQALRGHPIQALRGRHIQALPGLPIQPLHLQRPLQGLRQPLREL